MKKILLILFSLISFQFVNGQNCFIVFDDITGIENQVDILEQAACSLRDSLPSDFQNDFKVIHIGLYLHTPVMTDAIEEIKANATVKASTISSNYLLIIHQLYSDGHSEYDVEIRLPKNWLSECYDELIINAFINSVKARFKALQSEYPNPLQKTQVEVKGIEYLAKRIGEYTDCCIPGSNLKNSSCSSCITAYDVLNELDNLGFKTYFAGEVTNSDPNTDQDCICQESIPAAKHPNNETRSLNFVDDYAGLTIEVDNVTYDFATELLEWTSQDNVAFVTKNSNYCDQTLFQILQSNFINSSQAIWVHVWENPKEDDEDIVFIKIKEISPSGNIAPPNIETLQIQADPPPPFEYTILHRSFAPWDRFGHMPILPNVHIARNSFWGDNRGFSLNDPDLVFPGTTARIHQDLNIKLGVGKTENQRINNPFSSITRGYVNFKRKEAKRFVPHPYKEELDHWEYEPVQEKEDFCNPSGFENSIVQNNITYTAMFFEGSDPLIVFPMVAPDIEWYLELGLYYTNSESMLNISGRLIGKSFPAYEAYIEDKCGNKMFLYTYSAPCESELANELLNPIPDYNEGFDISVKVDENGCFLSNVTTTYNGNTQNTDLQSWNQHNLSKAAAQDCPNNPCQGAYPNDGSDKRSEFNCGD